MWISILQRGQVATQKGFENNGRVEIIIAALVKSRGRGDNFPKGN